MASTVPEGHPGDVMWRLPLSRTLSTLKLVHQGQFEQAQQATKKGGFFITHLIDAGVPAEKVMTSLASISGAQVAARGEVRKPDKAASRGFDMTACRQLLAVPYKREGDSVHVAFVAPIDKDRLAAFPGHIATVAPEADVRAALEVLWPSNIALSGTSVALVAAPPPQANAAELDAAIASTDLAPPPPKAAADPHSDEELEKAGLTLTKVEPREELISQLKKARVPVAVVVGALILIKGISVVIAHSRDEVANKADSLGKALTPQKGAPSPKPGPDLEEPEAPAPRAEGPRGTFNDVSAGIGKVDVALRAKDLAGFGSACRSLGENLQMWAPNAPALTQKVDARSLAVEIRALCEAELGAIPEERWVDLKGRLNRVLAGESPTPGPRYQLDEPKAVSEAITETDAALLAGNMAGACAGLSKFRNAVSDWMMRMPGGQRVMRMNEVVNQDCEEALMACSKLTVAQLQARFNQMKTKINPG